MDSFPSSYYPVNPALLHGERCPVRTLVMDQIVHILAEQFVHASISQSAQAGRVAKRAAVFEVNPINGFGGRVEKKPESVLTFSQRPFRAFSLCDVGHHANYPHHLA